MAKIGTNFLVCSFNIFERENRTQDIEFSTWMCWCIDAADVLMLMMHRCTDSSDALIILMRCCFWCTDTPSGQVKAVHERKGQYRADNEEKLKAYFAKNILRGEEITGEKETRRRGDSITITFTITITIIAISCLISSRKVLLRPTSPSSPFHHCTMCTLYSRIPL